MLNKKRIGSAGSAPAALMISFMRTVSRGDIGFVHIKLQYKFSKKLIKTIDKIQMKWYNLIKIKKEQSKVPGVSLLRSCFRSALLDQIHEGRQAPMGELEPVSQISFHARWREVFNKDKTD